MVSFRSCAICSAVWLIAAPLATFGQQSSLLLAPGGSLNGQPVDASHRWVRIGLGDTLAGTVNTAVHCVNSPGAIVKLGYTVTWGNRESQPVQTSTWSGPLESTASVLISMPGPSEPGVYFLLMSFAGRYSIDQVLSATHAGASAMWYDGNDLGWDWNVSQYHQAQQQGYADIDLWNGSTFEPHRQATAWVGIIVGEPSSVRLAAGGSVNGQSIDLNHRWVEVGPSEPISGSVNVDIACTNSPGAIVPMGYTTTWGERSARPVLIDQWTGPRTGQLSFGINQVAPAEAGEYYLPISYAGRYSLDQVFSATHAGASPVWNDGNDLGWDWNAAQYEQAQDWGFVAQETLFPDGSQYYTAQAATWIGVRVLPGPVAWWCMEDKQGNQIPDRSGNGHTLTVWGAPTFVGTSVVFNDDGELQATDHLDLDLLNDWTISFWLREDVKGRRPNGNNVNGWISKVASYHDAEGGWFVYSYPDSLGTTIYGSPNCGQDTVEGLPLGEWHRITATFDHASMTVRIYVDALLKLQEVTSCSILNNGHPVTLGGDTGFDLSPEPYARGAMADVRIYDRTLSATEIASRLSQGHGPGPDSDSDGWADSVDNCLDVLNPDQADVDADRIGDVCDACPNDALNDEDHDGVCGDIDECPGTPSCATVDAKGCPMDSDGDGVPDGCDACPDSPPGSWVSRLTGCPTSRADLDRDGDVDQDDFAILQRCFSGPSILADPNCGQ